MSAGRGETASVERVPQEGAKIVAGLQRYIGPLHGTAGYKWVQHPDTRNKDGMFASSFAGMTALSSDGAVGGHDGLISRSTAVPHPPQPFSHVEKRLPGMSHR